MENKTNGLGIASMVVGIVALLISCCYGGFLGIVGLILGIVAVRKPRNGTAIAGIITSGLALLITLLMLIAGVGSFSDYIEQSKESSTESNISTEASQLTDNTVENGPEITLDEFNQIETGMTYQQVVDIIGSDGTLSSENVIADITTKMYIWYGKDGISNANFIFQDDSLTNKSQFGLQ